MQCPYVDCDATLPDGSGNCNKCLRNFKMCKATSCGRANRRFARFCHACGSSLGKDDSLGENENDWAMFQGGIQRTGLNRVPLTHGFSSFDRQSPLETLGSFQLRNRCHSLLLSEGRLIALSANGEVLVVDVQGDTANEISRFSLGGEVFAEPAIAGGMLFAATGDWIKAYALGSTADGGVSDAPYWQMQLTGRARHSLLAVKDLLYCMTEQSDGTELVALSRIFTSNPKQTRMHRSPAFSPLAGKVTPQGCKVYFIENRKGVTLYEIEHTGKDHGDMTSRTLNDLQDYAQGTPICVVGGMLFGIFGKRKQLCCVRISPDGKYETRGEDVETFAFAEISTSILVSSNWIANTGNGTRGELDAGESYRGMPVVIGGSVVAVSLNGGMVRLYELRDLSHSRNWQCSVNGSEVTALISAGPLLIVGDARGKVTIARFP